MQPPNCSSPSRPPARLRRGGVREHAGPGDKVAPAATTDRPLPVAGSSLSRRGHEEATGTGRPAPPPPVRAPALAATRSGVGAAAVEKQSRDGGGTDGRREGRKVRRREGGAGRAGKGGGTAGGGRGGTDPRGDSGHPGRPPACPPLCTEGRIAQPDLPAEKGPARPVPHQPAPAL